MSMPAIKRFLHSQPILAVCFASLATASFAQEVSDSGLVVQPYLNLTGLSRPTGLRFSGPGEGFLIEKETGQVKHFGAGNLSTVLDLNVQFDSERGLLGIALDPQFQSSGFVYLYYSATQVNTDSSSSSNWAGNRLVRYQWNGSALVDTGVSRTLSVPAGGQAQGPNHDGGPLTFGPDGKLYGVTGDLNRDRAEQNNQSNANTTSGVGGIYRLNSDLSVPSGSAANPFSGSFSQWYAYGVRNSFGLAFDPRTGRLWDTENGPSSYDEINLVEPGFNSGWNKIMGPDSRSPQNAPGDLVVLPGSAYSDPEFSFRDPVAVTSLAFLAGSAWGSAYENGLIVGDNNTGRLYLLQLNQARDGFVLSGVLGDKVADGDAQESLLAFGSGFGVVTDLQIGPDHALYVLSLSEGQVYRIAPVPEPATWALLLATLLPVIWIARRRRG
jgi:aldose sugar dehydrogenase